MKEFVMGIALGMAGGALVVANSCKLRKMIRKNQEEIMQKAESYIDQQLEKASCKASDGVCRRGLTVKLSPCRTAAGSFYKFSLCACKMRLRMI